MADWAGWIAPIATTIAAMMTAANLGPRVTGWGFVVFLVGSIAWGLVGFATDQANLLWQNAILTTINAVGIWRWLGRESRWHDGAAHAVRRSRRQNGAMFAASGLIGMTVEDPAGEGIGTVVDAMFDCGSGTVRYVVVREGGLAGIGERLHAVDWPELAAAGDALRLISPRPLSTRDTIPAERWPARAQPT